MSWWDRASKEQRLAQIDGGLECRMTANQVAMVSGARSAAIVGAYANHHGRHFSQRRRRSPMHGLRAAYWQGERDFNITPAVSGRVVDDDFDGMAP